MADCSDKSGATSTTRGGLLDSRTGKRCRSGLDPTALPSQSPDVVVDATLVGGLRRRLARRRPTPRMNRSSTSLLAGGAVQHIVIALFDQEAQARSAADALVRQGFERASVQVTGAGGDPHAQEPLPPAAAIEGGPASGLLHRLAVLFGVDDEPHVVHYEEAVRRGGSLVKVEVDGEARATAARDALLALGAVNIDDRVEEWRQAGWDDTGRT